MPLVHVFESDALTAKFPTQICNTTTRKSRGFSKAMFKRFPEADAYSRRYDPSTPESVPGTIETYHIRGQVVRNFFAQMYPGRPRSERYRAQRILWFKKCLKTAIHEGATELDVPFRMGCGLAGGHWEQYLAVLRTYSSLTVRVHHLEKRGPCRVVSIRTADLRKRGIQNFIEWSRRPDAFYVGRRVRAVIGTYDSVWRNTFPVSLGRDECIAMYKNDLQRVLERRVSLDDLAGMELGCWCFPKACHGDVLADLVNAN